MDAGHAILPGDMAGTGRFTKSDKLLSRAQFDAVFARKQSVGDRRLTLFFAPNQAGQPRLGLVVSTAFGNAVKRNLFKRRLREIFRRHRALLGAVDVIAMPARHGEARSAGHAELEQSWLALCVKASARGSN